MSSMQSRSHLQLVRAATETDGLGCGRTPARGEAAPADLEEAFRQYAPLVGSIAFRILGSRDEMQDLVQDVFLKAHDWLGRIEDPGALKSWLITVTVREARLRLRLQRMRSFLGLRRSFDYESVAASNASPAQRTLTAEIYALLERVSVDARVAWTLRYVEGLTLPEIAHHCRCSLATVKRRVTSVQAIITEALDDG
jgi:RNA polymerase sigma-70 factor (ECF subfamily)